MEFSEPGSESFKQQFYFRCECIAIVIYVQCKSILNSHDSNTCTVILCAFFNWFQFVCSSKTLLLRIHMSMISYSRHKTLVLLLNVINILHSVNVFDFVVVEIIESIGFSIIPSDRLKYIDRIAECVYVAVNQFVNRYILILLAYTVSMIRAKRRR